MFGQGRGSLVTNALFKLYKDVSTFAKCKMWRILIGALGATSVCAYPERFGTRTFFDVGATRFMHLTGRHAVLVTETTDKNLWTIECESYGVIVDVPSETLFLESVCTDKLQSLALNATTTRYRTIHENTATCGIQTNAEVADVLCAVPGTPHWYADFFNKSHLNAHRTKGSLNKAPGLDADPLFLFVSSVWIMGVGIAAHAAARWWKSQATVLVYTHYVLMLVGVALAGAAIANIRNGRFTRSFEHKTHGKVGMAAFVLMCLNAFAGMVHVAMGKKHRWAGTLHRLNGIVIVALVGYLHFSGANKDGPAKAYKDFPDDAMVSFYAWAVLVPAVGAASFWYYANAVYGTTEQRYTMVDKAFDGTAPNLMNL